MRQKKDNKFRNRKFCLLLYPEDETHMKAIEYIKTHYKYALIKHDKDVEDTGEVKKEHFHVVVAFDNAKWNTALAEELQITSNYIQKCANFENALEYLIHYNDQNKHQYSIDEVQGTLKIKLAQFLLKNDTTEDDRVQYMFDYINEMDLPISIRAFSEFCHIMGIWADFRRNANIIFKLIDEHNARVQKNSKRG